MKDQTRNLKPIPEARVAMIIWGLEYSEQRGGSMDFWDSLGPDKQRRCKFVVNSMRELSVSGQFDDALEQLCYFPCDEQINYVAMALCWEDNVNELTTIEMKKEAKSYRRKAIAAINAVKSMPINSELGSNVDVSI